MTKQQRLFRINRRIGWIMSLGGAALFLAQAPVMLRTIDDYSGWWNLSVAVLVVMVLGLAAFGWLLPRTILNVCWRIGPMLGALSMLTAFAAYDGPRPPESLPWILTFDAALSGYLLLWQRAWVAAIGTIIMALLVPLSALLFLGEVPRVVLIAMPIHMSNIVFIAIFEGIRQRMVALRAARDAAEESWSRQIRASAEAEHLEHVSRMLHDEVISVLTGAYQIRGVPSERLRAEARRAIDLLDTPAPPPAPTFEPCHIAVERLVRAAHEVDPMCPTKTSSLSGLVPTAVTNAIIGAVNEALRNSLRHSGSDARRTLSVYVESSFVEVIVRDDGLGFDTEVVRPESLGISRSIIGRMRSLPGGGAVVSSRLGGPTTVELTWRN